MSLHEATIEWIVTHCSNETRHYKRGNLKVDGRLPDLYVEDKSGNIIEIHEVQCVSKEELPKRPNMKRVLWLVVSGDWDEIKAINQKGIATLEKIRIKIGNLDHLEFQIQRYQKRLKRIQSQYRKKFSEKMDLAKEDKRIIKGFMW